MDLEDDLGQATALAESLPTMATPEPTTETNVLKPEKSIMGEVLLLSKDSWPAWTGGMPKSDWSGLDPSSLQEPTSPNQLRPVHVAAAQKRYNHCRTRMTIPFKPANDLITSQNSVWDHLVDTGMDTIASLPDPTDKNKVSKVVKLHSSYTIQSTQALIKDEQVELYDNYDKTDDNATRTYLLA